jgi:DNA-binding NtrC family response regulator
LTVINWQLCVPYAGLPCIGSTAAGDPPPSERNGDAPLPAQPFLKQFAAAMHKQVLDIQRGAMALLGEYDFPGNVREPANLIEGGVAMSSGHTLETEHLPEDLEQLQIRAFRHTGPELPTLEQQQAEYIRWVPEHTDGNRSRAADIPGIDRVSLWRKINEYELQAATGPAPPDNLQLVNG